MPSASIRHDAGEYILTVMVVEHIPPIIVYDSFTSRRINIVVGSVHDVASAID